MIPPHDQPGSPTLSFNGSALPAFLPTPTIPNRPAAPPGSAIPPDEEPGTLTRIGHPCAAPRRSPPDEVGRYQLLGEIGRGGMGLVLRGRDPVLGRDLALKVLLEECCGDPELRQRFLAEAQIGGQLQHPGIVPVHELGEFPDGRPYFAMKLVEGRTLAELLAARATVAEDLPRWLKVFEQVCQTLAYAHARHVLHRDLKPSNVMVGAFGEVQVMDWGLAKVIGVPEDPVSPGVPPPVRSDVAGVVSLAGDVRGTPAYMAPEQARGENYHLDARCDVFGLGAILCEILTGQPPYTGGDGTVVYGQAALADLGPARRRLRECGADPELVRIAHDCLAEWPADRPPDAGAVAGRVTAYLAGVQDRLRRAELDRSAAQTRAQEERKRRRLALALAGAVLALALLGGGAFFWVTREKAARLAEQARAAREKAEAVALTTSKVNEALDRARRLRADAKAVPGGLDLWAEALAAVRQAEALLADGPVEEELQGRVRAFAAALAAEAADRRLLADIDELLLRKSAIKAGDFDHQSADAGYAAAFRRYGIDPEKQSVEEAAAHLRDRPIRAELAAALDDWSMICKVYHTRADDSTWRRLIDLARAIDPDPWRNRLRAALRREPDAGGREEIIACSNGINDQPKAALLLLTTALGSVGENGRAVAVLRKARERFPGDFWVNYGLAVRLQDRGPAELDEALRCMAAAVALRGDNGAVYQTLGTLLARKHLFDEADAAFARAVRLAPDLATAYHNWGMIQARQPGKLDRGIDCLRKALTLPAPPRNAVLTWTELGVALAIKGDAAESLAAHTKAVELEKTLRPRLPNALVGLAAHYRDVRRDPAGAAALLRQALEIDPASAFVLTELGRCEAVQRHYPEAVAALRAAVRHDPAFRSAWFQLAATLLERGDARGALEAVGESLKLDPSDPEGYHLRGLALLGLKRADEAVLALREALALNPGHAEAWRQLGNACKERGNLGDAIAAYREAVRLEPKSPVGWYNLGYLYQDANRLDDAVAAYRTMLKLNPDHAEGHCNLGQALRRQGKFAEALAEFRRGHDLGSRRADWGYPSAQWVRTCERLLEMDERLARALDGKERPAARDWLALAEFCRQEKRAAVPAARCFAAAFAAEPALADDPQTVRRYRAAAAAALVGCGADAEARRLSAEERSQWRKQSREWLRADLDAWAKLVADTPRLRGVASQTLRSWQRDTVLAAVRDRAALEKLPAEDRAAFAELWKDVAALLVRIEPR